MRPIENLGTWCVRFLKMAIAVETLFFLYSIAYLLHLEGIGGDGYFGSMPFADIIDVVSLLVFIPYLVVLLACYFICGRWIVRASHNASVMSQGGSDRITPGWAVGWYFIPIMNLFKPFQAMRQTWNSTFNPSKDIDSPVESALSWWWGAWIVSNILGQISYRTAASGSASALYTSTYADLLNYPITLVAIYFFMRIIQAVSAGQTRDNIHETFA